MYQREKASYLRPIRLCSVKQKQYINFLLDKCMPSAKEVQKPTILHNLYVEGQYFYFQTAEQISEFNEFIANMLKQFDKNTNPFLITCGFLFNPRDNSTTQDFQIDFDDKTSSTIFIPIAHLISENSPQVACIKTKNHFTEANIMGKTEIEVLTQIVCKPYTIIKMNSDSIHRGIGNRSNIDRPMFFINSGSKKLGLTAEKIEDTSMHEDY